ncbi:membrane protein insertase YidC [Bacillus thuringiensis]|uniref:membrane protein insertase YidC n=1 Tax=Bacillus thuringiensis TaxID=1428 RepID=UPI003B9811F1
MFKAYRILLCMLLLISLAGCNNTDPIHAHSTGIWNQYFVYPLSFMMQWVAQDISGGNFGISIIMITIIIRFALVPLSISQHRGQLKMKQVQPKLQKLKEKYGHPNKNLHQQQEYQKEMSELMKNSGWNPLAGCWPIFIQLPIFSALYYAISRTEEIRTALFLWMDLGHADPYYILPILAAFTTWLQMKNMKVSTLPSEQMQIMKLQQYLIPGMIIVIGCITPAGLVLYWITSNVFTILQTFIFKKVWEEEMNK